jgi:predicted cupin superfamily sugar epimerase
MMSMSEEVRKIIDRLELKKHPEGGFYKEVYRSIGESKVDIDRGNIVIRNFATSIYFLITSDEFSAFHKIKQDEIWHFYQGNPITIHMLSKELGYQSKVVGHLQDTSEPQFIVPANTWFATEVNRVNSYALVGCGVAPGFNFDDFELAKKDELEKEYPEYKDIIALFTRN